MNKPRSLKDSAVPDIVAASLCVRVPMKVLEIHDYVHSATNIEQECQVINGVLRLTCDFFNDFIAAFAEFINAYVWKITFSGGPLEIFVIGMAEKIVQDDDTDTREIAIMDPNNKRSSENSIRLKTDGQLKTSASHPTDKSQSGVANISSKTHKKNIDGSASVPDIPEDKIVTDKGLVMTTPQRKSRSACRARSRDPRKCQINFREMIGKHEMRNEELEQLEGDLRERLDMLECSMPAVMVWNVLRMGQGASPSVIRQLMEKQLQGVHAAGNVAIPSTPSQHYDYRVREIEAERKEALRRAEEARALLTDKEAAVEERRKRLENAKKCNQERKERVERLNRETAELREATKDARGDGTSCQAGECGEIRCKERLLDDIGSLSSIGSTDLECFAKLQDLAESEICMKRQISELERREEVYMRTLQQADELWSKMEGDNADSVRELQEQLHLKMTANQGLADRVCQLEDQLEKSAKRLLGCKEELGKYTSKVYTDAEIGFKDGVATAEDRSIVAGVKTATSFASASPQTVDIDSTVRPETMDKASSIVPASDEKGVGVIKEMFDKASEAIVDQREREVGRPIGLGIDAGIGDARIGELDDSVSQIDSDEKHKSGRPKITEPTDKEGTPETIQNFYWDEGYPPDAIVKDMVETSTGMEREQPVTGAFVSDAKVQATVETVEQPVGGNEAEDIAEIIREVSISSKIELGRASVPTSIIQHADGTTMTTEDRHETDQLESDEKVMSPTRIDKDHEVFVEEMKHGIDDTGRKSDQAHSGKRSATKHAKVLSTNEAEAQLEDEVDEITYEPYETDSQKRTITKSTEMFDKRGDTIIDHREHGVHKPTHETYYPSTDKQKSTEHTKITDKNIAAVRNKRNDDLENDVVVVDQPYPGKEADSKRVKEHDTDRKVDPMNREVQPTIPKIVRSDSEKNVEKHPKIDDENKKSIADRRKVDETALKYDKPDSDDSNIRKRSTKPNDDNEDVAAPMEHKIETFRKETDRLESTVKSPSKRSSVLREDGEAVITKQGHKVGRTAQERDEAESDKSDVRKGSEILSKVDETALKYDKPDFANSDIGRHPTKLRDDNGKLAAPVEHRSEEFIEKTDRLDSTVKSPSKRSSVFREDGKAVVAEQGHKVGRTTTERDKAESDESDVIKSTEILSKVNETALKYDKPDFANSDIRRRSTKPRDENGNVAATSEHRSREFVEKPVRLDSTVKRPGKRSSVFREDGEAVVDEQSHKVGRTAHERDQADSDERDASKRTKIFGKDSEAVVESVEHAVDRLDALRSEDDVEGPKVDGFVEDRRKGDDGQKTGRRRSKALELEDDEEIPEAWKNWNWDEGCPPDAICTNEDKSLSRKGDARRSESFPKVESKVQASVEMIEQSVGRRESETIAEQDRMARDIDSSSLTKTTDSTRTTQQKSDRVVLSREELRNWYNIVNSVHHKISRCISCKSEVDAIAQLMGKMNNHIRMMALADGEDPIAYEEMRQSLMQMPKMEAEILKDVASDPSEYRKSQRSLSAAAAQSNVETISSIDTGTLADKNENLNNVLREADDSSREKVGTTDTSIARATIQPEDTHSSTEAADTVDRVLETVASKTSITKQPTALDNGEPTAASLQSLSADKTQDVEALFRAGADKEEKSSSRSMSTEEELSKALAQQAEEDNIPNVFDGDTQALEIEQPVLTSRISTNSVVDKKNEEEVKTPLSTEDDTHTFEETFEEIKSPASWAVKDEGATSQSKIEREKPIQPPESAQLCMCTPPLCRPIITCTRVPNTEGTQTSPQIPRTLNRIKVKPITESSRPPPDVIMWRRPLIWSKRRKDKSTLTAVCADTQTDSGLARERVTQRGVDWKDDCTCSGVSPTTARFGGSDKRVMSHHRNERLPAPVGHTVAELFASSMPRPSVSSKEKEISVTQYTDKSLTPEDSEVCCVECGKPIASEATLASLNANVRTGAKAQKGLMRTLKKIATSSTSRIARKKDDFTCCACKLLDKDKAEDVSGRIRKKIEKSSHGKNNDTELSCPCPPEIKQKKTEDASKPSKKRRKPEKKDQGVMANIPRSKFKKPSKDRDGRDRSDPTVTAADKIKAPSNQQCGPSKTSSKVTSSSSKMGSKHGKNTPTELIDKKSRDESRADGAVKKLATKASGTKGSSQCGCDDDNDVLVPYTDYTAVFKTNITNDVCACSSSIESTSQDGTCNCADRTK